MEPEIPHLVPCIEGRCEDPVCLLPKGVLFGLPVVPWDGPRFLDCAGSNFLVGRPADFRRLHAALTAYTESSLEPGNKSLEFELSLGLGEEDDFLFADLGSELAPEVGGMPFGLLSHGDIIRASPSLQLCFLARIDPDALQKLALPVPTPEQNTVQDVLGQAKPLKRRETLQSVEVEANEYEIEGTEHLLNPEPIALYGHFDPLKIAEWWLFVFPASQFFFPDFATAIQESYLLPIAHLAQFLILPALLIGVPFHGLVVPRLPPTWAKRVDHSCQMGLVLLIFLCFAPFFVPMMIWFGPLDLAKRMDRDLRSGRLAQTVGEALDGPDVSAASPAHPNPKRLDP